MITDTNILLAAEVKHAVNAIFCGKSRNNVRAMSVAATAAAEMQLPRYAVMEALAVSSDTLNDLAAISEMYRDMCSASFSTAVALAVDAVEEARRRRYGDEHHGIECFYGGDKWGVVSKNYEQRREARRLKLEELRRAKVEADAAAEELQISD
ncbi:MAG: hypothetical protein ACI30W_03230 [Muribaculaceae bacterium]